MGEQMILGNIEYIPHMLLEDFRPYVFYDVGKTTGPEDDIFLDGVVRSSIGLGLRLGKEIRVTVAKSLEDSGADPKLWVTFGKSF
jgi:hemolysin activation/secretion protein